MEWLYLLLGLFAATWLYLLRRTVRRAHWPTPLEADRMRRDQENRLP